MNYQSRSCWLEPETIQKEVKPVVAAARMDGRAVSQPERHMPSDSSDIGKHDNLYVTNVVVQITLQGSAGVRVMWGTWVRKHRDSWGAIAVISWVMWCGIVWEMDLGTIRSQSGHPGVWCTAYFVWRVCPLTMKAVVKSAIQDCKECRKVDPATVHWQKGRHKADSNW